MVTFEQAVYGSFAFRGDGYAPLANSPGCRPDWLAAFHVACRSIGEKPPGAGDLAGMMFAMRWNPRGPWMIVGVSSMGSDDRGRPDALAFHALFMEGREFRKVGYDPFLLRGALRSDWGPETTLDRGTIAPQTPDESESSDRASAVATALKRGRKIALASDAPNLDLAREVWRLLPVRVRKRCAVATWAFAESSRFDLVAARSLAGWELGGAYVDPFAIRPPSRRRPVRIGIIAVGVAALVAYGASQWWHSGEEARIAALAEIVDPADDYLPQRSIDPTPGPARSAYADEAASPGDRDEVLERLRKFSKDFHVPSAALPRGQVPTPDDKSMSELIQMIYCRRYNGPLLNSEEVSALARDPSPGRSRALAWDRQIRHFVADRPLPGPLEGSNLEMLGSGPLRWQVDWLAWSFHVEPDPKLTILEAIDALADALTLDEPIRRNPLEATYPALAEYAKFLAKLPVR